MSRSLVAWKRQAGVAYVRFTTLVVQLLVDGDNAATCRDLSGAAIARWAVRADELEQPVHGRVLADIGRPGVRLHVILQDGSSLAQRPHLG